MELWEELQQKDEMLKYCIKSLQKNGRALAEAERAYKVLLREECLKLRDEGMPVTLIEKICYGIPSVADARFARDIAEAAYKANQEAIMGIKLQMKIIDAQIDREWGQA